MKYIIYCLVTFCFIPASMVLGSGDVDYKAVKAPQNSISTAVIFDDEGQAVCQYSVALKRDTIPQQLKKFGTNMSTVDMGLPSCEEEAILASSSRIQELEGNNIVAGLPWAGIVVSAGLSCLTIKLTDKLSESFEMKKDSSPARDAIGGGITGAIYLTVIEDLFGFNGDPGQTLVTGGVVGAVAGYLCGESSTNSDGETIVEDAVLYVK